MDPFTKQVEKSEDRWFAGDPDGERRRHLDSHILDIVSRGRVGVAHVWMPDEVTLYAPNKWQWKRGIAKLLKVGATTKDPPCDVKCTRALNRLLVALKRERAGVAVSCVAIDAKSGTCQGGSARKCTLHMDQSHVHGIVRDSTGRVSVIEPTPGAPWFDDFNTFYTKVMPARCQAAGLTFKEFREGASYDHRNLCRYKIGYDMLDDVNSWRRFQKKVRGVLKELETTKE